MASASVYIPVFNNASWCERLAVESDLSYIAADNASTDGSGEILRGKGINVLCNESDLGRVGNWKFCVEHFIESGSIWLKWLFAGDAIAPHFAGILERASTEYPSARLIIGNFQSVEGNTRKSGKVWFTRPRLMQPEETLRRIADRSFSFGPPIAQVIHRDAVADGFEFGDLPFVADITFCLNIAKRHPVLYLPEIFGDFCTSERKFFSAHRYALSTALEDGLYHQKAAMLYRDVTGDRKGYERLLEHTNKATESSIIRSAAVRAVSAKDMFHIAEMLPARMIPELLFRKLLRACGRRLTNGRRSELPDGASRDE